MFDVCRNLRDAEYVLDFFASCLCFLFVSSFSGGMPHSSSSRVTLCALSYRRYDDSPRLVEKVCENMMDAHVMRLLQVRCCAVVVMLMTAAAVVVYSKCLLGNALNVMRRRPRRWICRIFMPPVQV